MKKVIRSVVIFWGIVAIFPLCYLIYFFFTTGDGSYWLFGARDGQASATTWLDSNANGIQDIDEKPLANVCIWSGYSPESGIPEFLDPCKGHYQETTNEQGQWSTFLPGGGCDEVFVFVRVPEGYRPTTNLASNSCEAKFGFVPDTIEVKQKIINVEQFIQRQTVILWAKRTAIGLLILLIGIFGTIRLQKNP